MSESPAAARDPFETCPQEALADCLGRRLGHQNDDVACVHFFLATSGSSLRAPKEALEAIQRHRAKINQPRFHWIEVAVDPGADGFEKVERFVQYGLPVTVLFRGWKDGAQEYIERRLAWPPGDDDKYRGVTKWVDDFVKATRTRQSSRRARSTSSPQG